MSPVVKKNLTVRVSCPEHRQKKILKNVPLVVTVPFNQSATIDSSREMFGIIGKCGTANLKKVTITKSYTQPLSPKKQPSRNRIVNTATHKKVRASIDN